MQHAHKICYYIAFALLALVAMYAIDHEAMMQSQRTGEAYSRLACYAAGIVFTYISPITMMVRVFIESMFGIHKNPFVQ